MSTTPVDPVLEMLIAGEWVDITADCHQGDAEGGGGFDIVRGVPNEGNSAEPSQLNFTINNGASKVPATLGQSGIYSPMNPMGPYFNLLGQNQRVRLGLDRRTDDFNRTTVDGWGYIPDRTHADGVTNVEGEQWHHYGNPGGFSTSASVASIVGAATHRMAMFRRQYRDVDIRAKLRVNALTSEVGFVMRSGGFVLDPPPGTTLADTTGWTSSNSTLAADTGQFRGENTQSIRMTVTGTPASAAISNVVGATTMWESIRGANNAYYARAWVRSSNTTTVRIGISWYADDAVDFLSSVTADHAITANTWTAIDVAIPTPPQDAYYARFLVSFPSGTAPQNGWQLWLQDPEVHDTTSANYLLAGLQPGTPDLLRIYKHAAGDIWDSTGTATAELTTGVDWWFRAQQSGQRTRIKMWLASDIQPTAWGHRHFDDRTLEQNSIGRTGEVGIYILGAGATLQIRELWVDQWRAHAEVSSLPPRFDLSRQIHWIPVQARGILRRLGQGRKSLKSAVSLHLEEYADLSSGWWLLERDTGDSAGNNIDGQLPGTLSAVSFGAPDSGSGITALPGVSGVATLSTDDSFINLSIGSHALSSDEYETLLWFARLPALPASEITMATIYSSGGTVRTWKINVAIGGGFRITGYDRTGAAVTTDFGAGWNGNADLPTGCWIAFTFIALRDGSNVDYGLNHHRPGSTSFWTINNSFAGTVGALSGVNLRSSAAHTAAGSLQVAQVMHYAGDLPFVNFDFAAAARAYDQEAAASRFLRLGGNARLPVITSGLSTASNPQGVQSPSKVIDLMDESGEADGGFIVEERDDFCLTFVTRNGMWNRPPLELDIDAGHLTTPLDGEFDDQLTRNDSTIGRLGGSFRRAVQLTGPKNINPPEDDPYGVGIYDEQKEINVGTDELCMSHASWRVSRGTLLGPRYASIHANVVATAYQNDPVLAVDAMGIDIGDALLLVNTEADYIPRLQQVQGYTESIRDLYERDLTWNTQPGDTRQAGVVNYSTRVGASDLAVHADFDAGTDTTLQVSSADGFNLVRPIKTDIHYPFEIDIVGVRLRVTMVGTVLNSNSDFEAGTTGWEASSVNATIADDRFDPKGGVLSLRITSVGAGTDGAVVTMAARPAASAATDYLVCGWVKTEVAATAFHFTVDWYDSGGGFLSSSLPATITTTALVWTWFAATVTSPASTASARPRARNVFAGASRMWVDNLRLYPVSSYDGSPQTVIVEQAPVNADFGVTGKAIPAGSAIEVVDAMRMGWGVSQ